MTIFTQYEEKPLTPKRKLSIWLMLFILVPLVSYASGKAQLANKHYAELERINSQPVNVALPNELPTNIYDF